MDLTNPQIVMRDREIAQLKEELAKEREKVKELEDAYDQAGRTIQVQGRELIAAESRLHEVATHCANKEEQLAAAQATIEQMRGFLHQCEQAVCRAQVSLIVGEALASASNLDALHEDRARTLLALLPDGGIDANDGIAVSVILHEATKHRATKEEGK